MYITIISLSFWLPFLPLALSFSCCIYFHLPIESFRFSTTYSSSDNHSYSQNQDHRQQKLINDLFIFWLYNSFCPSLAFCCVAPDPPGNHSNSQNLNHHSKTHYVVLQELWKKNFFFWVILHLSVYGISSPVSVHLHPYPLPFVLFSHC